QSASSHRRGAGLERPLCRARSVPGAALTRSLRKGEHGKERRGPQRKDTDVMGDIGRRINRYRLGRYAPDRVPLGRRLRVVWLIAMVWLAWAAFISEHSFYRTWRLDR